MNIISMNLWYTIITTTTIDIDIDHFKRSKKQKIRANQGQFADNSLSF